MNTFLLVVIVATIPLSALFVFLYLRSSNVLLALVRKKDEALWQELGCPERVRAGRGETISPLFPWLYWIWSGKTDVLTHDIAWHLTTTRNYLRISLALLLGSFVALPLLLFMQ